MKTKLFLPTILLAVFFNYSCSSGPRTVEKPVHGLKNTSTLEIDKIVMSDSATTVYASAFFYPNMWIRIGSDTYLQANGVKYTITGAEGIELDGEHYLSESGEDSFILTFPPLPAGTKTVDFIEGDCPTCFKIWDINLTGKTKRYQPQIPADLLKAKIDPNDSLPAPEFKIGKTKLTVHLTGVKEGYNPGKVVLHVSNIFTNEGDEIYGQGISDGVYLFEYDQFVTCTAFLHIDGNDGKNILVTLAPGEDAEVYLDLTARSKKRSRYNPEPDLPYYAFRGEFADANNLYMKYRDSMNVLLSDFPKIGSDPAICEMTTEQYVHYLMGIYDKELRSIETSDFPIIVKQQMKAELKGSLVFCIPLIQYIYHESYNSLKKISPERKVSAPSSAKEKEILLLKAINPNDSMWLYSPLCYYSVCYLAGFWENPELIDELTGSTTGILQDLRKFSPILLKARNIEPLTDEDEQALASFTNPFYRELYDYVSESTRIAYENALKDTQVKVVDVPQVANDKLMDAILADYKGKVVFIDFWGTWCGPCLMAMETIKPFKPEMKEHGIVSLYFADETSAKDTWLKKIPEIGGIHYYFTNEQLNHLKQKYQFNGVPAYLIIDKQGNKVFQSVGYPGNDAIKAELEKVW